MAGVGKPRATERTQQMGHKHSDKGATVDDQVGWLDEIARLAHARYDEFNPVRVQQLQDHLRVVESFLETLYTETPYVNVDDLALDDPRRKPAIAARRGGFEAWKEARG
jgi:hypothetical protein